MSLFKQLALIILGIFLLLFIIVVGVSFGVIKKSAEQALYQNAQNSATSITLSIDSIAFDRASVQTVINAAFDNGNYEKIIYFDTDGKEVYSRVKKDANKNKAPLWFKRIVVLKQVSAQASLSDGWHLLGRVVVYSDLEVVYTQLYAIFLQLTVYLAIAYVGALLTLYLFLKYLLQPLAKIEKQAAAILNNKFIITKQLPKVLEFQSVTKSMNSMVKKVEQIFKTANDALKHNKELLYIDEVTKLYNRKYFSFKASEYISSGSANANGLLVLVNIQRAELMNKLIGYQKTDQFFINIAQLLNSAFLLNSASFTARLNGTEFIAMLPNVENSDIQIKLKEFQKNVYEGYEALELKDTDIDLNIGLCRYGEEKNIGELFAKIDYTFSNAKLSHSCEIVQVDEADVNMGKEKWRETLNNAIKNDNFIFEYKSITDICDKKTVYKTFNIILQTNQQRFDYSKFIAPLAELQMLNKFYFYVIKSIFAQYSDDTEPKSLILPYGFVEDDFVLQEFESILELYQNTNFQNLIFEIPEEAFVKRYDHTIRLINIFQKYGIKYAIYDFIANLNDYNFLKKNKPKYIVSDKTFIFDNAQNINLVNIIMESVEVEIVVSGELTKKQLQQLEALSLHYRINLIRSSFI